MEIEIYGDRYELNIASALAAKALKPIIQHKIGNTYRNLRTEEYYILATIGFNTIILVCLTDGRNWTEEVKVKDSFNITSADWDKIVGANMTENEAFDEFVLVKLCHTEL